MGQNRRVLAPTSSNSNLLTRLEKIIPDYCVVDFRFKDMVETLFTQLLRGFRTLFWWVTLMGRDRTLRMGRRVWHSSHTAFNLSFGAADTVAVSPSWGPLSMVLVGCRGESSATLSKIFSQGHEADRPIKSGQMQNPLGTSNTWRQYT